MGNRNLDLSRLGNTVSFLPALICLFSVLAVTIRDSLVWLQDGEQAPVVKYGIFEKVTVTLSASNY